MELIIIVVILFCTGSVVTQSIISPPNNATGVQGEDVEFQCELELGLENAMIWEFNGEAVYNTQFGEEDYPLGKKKYLATQEGNLFTLRVSNLTYDDGGRYMCSIRTVNVGANLVVLGKPHVMQDPPKPKEGDTALFTCEANYGAPGKEYISSSHFPQLQMFFNDGVTEANTNKKEPNKEKPYSLQQVHSMILYHNMHGKEVTCQIKTSYPDVKLVSKTKVYVEYPVRNVEFVPRQDEYAFGQVINCTADGNPPPTFQWRDNGKTENRAAARKLAITEGMAGNNEWECTATNVVDGTVYIDQVTAYFKAVRTVTEGQNNGWIIAVGVIVGLAVIVGLVVGGVFVLKKIAPEKCNMFSSPPCDEKKKQGHDNEGVQSEKKPLIGDNKSREKNQGQTSEPAQLPSPQMGLEKKQGHVSDAAKSPSQKNDRIQGQQQKHARDAAQSPSLQKDSLQEKTQKHVSDAAQSPSQQKDSLERQRGHASDATQSPSLQKNSPQEKKQGHVSDAAQSPSQKNDCIRQQQKHVSDAAQSPSPQKDSSQGQQQKHVSDAAQSPSPKKESLQERQRGNASDEAQSLSPQKDSPQEKKQGHLSNAAQSPSEEKNRIAPQGQKENDNETKSSVATPEDSPKGFSDKTMALEQNRSTGKPEKNDGQGKTEKHKSLTPSEEPNKNNQIEDTITSSRKSSAGKGDDSDLLSKQKGKVRRMRDIFEPQKNPQPVESSDESEVYAESD